MAPSRQKLTRVQNIHFRAISPEHRRCPDAPFSKPVPAPGLQTDVLYVSTAAVLQPILKRLSLYSRLLQFLYCTIVQFCRQEAMYQFCTHRGSRNMPECRSQHSDYATGWTVRSSSPGMDNRFIFSLKISDRPHSPPSLSLHGHREGSLSEIKTAEAWSWTIAPAYCLSLIGRPIKLRKDENYLLL
jgi:hypothetical protein